VIAARLDELAQINVERTAIKTRRDILFIGVRLPGPESNAIVLSHGMASSVSGNVLEKNSDYDPGKGTFN
jgi:hypothetical protein